MAETKHGVRVDWKVLRDFCEEVLRAAGVPENDARIVAASLVDADLSGMKSHGVTRLNDYLLRMEQSLMTPATKIDVVRETPSTALLDANDGWGRWPQRRLSSWWSRRPGRSAAPGSASATRTTTGPPATGP